MAKAKSKPQEKAGGSNVGKYKGVKSFCGPAGKAPSGSYPVNTCKRVKAALSYARHAPQPEKVKACARRAGERMGCFKTEKKGK